MDNTTVVFPEASSVTLQETKAPTIDPDEIKIETERSLISTGTELTILSGNFPNNSNWADYGEYPFEAGYCNVGTVIDAGSSVDDFWVGRHVATRIPHTRYSTLNPEEELCVPIPDDISLEEAAFFALAGITMNGVRQSRLEWGENVAIYGLGLLGQLAARFCRNAGARSVVGFDLAESRLGYLDEDDVISSYDPTVTDPQEVVVDAAGDDLADVVFEVTGVPSAIPNQFDVLRPQGRFVVLSSPRGPTKLDLHDYCNQPSYEIIGAHELSHAPHIQTGWSYGPLRWTHSQHYDLFFEYLKTGRLDVEPLISHRVPIEDAEEIYEQLLEDRTEALGVVLEW